MDKEDYVKHVGVGKCLVVFPGLKSEKALLISVQPDGDYLRLEFVVGENI